MSQVNWTEEDRKVGIDQYVDKVEESFTSPWTKGAFRHCLVKLYYPAMTLEATDDLIDLCRRSTQNLKMSRPIPETPKSPPNEQ